MKAENEPKSAPAFRAVFVLTDHLVNDTEDTLEAEVHPATDDEPPDSPDYVDGRSLKIGVSRYANNEHVHGASVTMNVGEVRAFRDFLNSFLREMGEQ